MTENNEKESWQIASLARGIKVLEAFNGTQPALSISEIAERTDISRAAARRIALTLHAMGYLSSAPRSSFSLTPRVLALATAYLSAHRIGDAVQPILVRLRALSGRSASVSVLDGHEIVYVARAAATGPMQMTIDVGQRLPAHVTAMGRVLLANLSDDALDEWLRQARLDTYRATTISSADALRVEILRVRAQDYSIADGEIASAVRALAVPIRGRDEQTLAALNLTTQSALHPESDDAMQYLDVLREAASEIALIWKYLDP